MADARELAQRQAQARAWFEALQAKLCAAFEALEADCLGPFAVENAAPGRFARYAVGAQGPQRRAEAAADGWRCFTAACSRRPACILDRPRRPSRRNSPSRFPAPRKTRASGRRAFR